MSKFNESDEHQEADGRSEIDPVFKAVICFLFGQLGIPVNKLDIIPGNYPLLMFASSKKKFKEFLLDTVKNNCFNAYVEFAYRVNPEITKEFFFPRLPVLKADRRSARTGSPCGAKYSLFLRNTQTADAS